MTEQASRLAADLTAAGLEFAETNPFAAPPRLPIGLLFSSPYVGRLKALWQEMRPVVNEIFPASPGVQPADPYLSHVAEIYTHDAYHSLSIEGYQVTPELIARIAAGEWNPATAATDSEQVPSLPWTGMLAHTASAEKSSCSCPILLSAQ